MLTISNHYYYLNLVKQINWGQIQFDLKDPEITFYDHILLLSNYRLWLFGFLCPNLHRRFLQINFNLKSQPV